MECEISEVNPVQPFELQSLSDVDISESELQVIFMLLDTVPIV